MDTRVDSVKNFLNRLRRHDGFSLTEVLVAMLVFSLLAAIAVPIYINQTRKAQENGVNQFLATTAVALKQARTENNGKYPKTLPAHIVIPDEVKEVSYTTPNADATYCLEVKHNSGGGLKSKYQKGNADGTTSQSSTSCAYAPSGAPGAPLLEGVMDSSSRALLSWGKIEGSAKYQILKNGAVVATTTNANIVSWKDPVALDTSVEYTVRAISTSGAQGALSNKVNLAPLKSKPTTAPALSLTGVTGSATKNTGTLLWTSVVWADKYEIRDADTNAVIWSGDKTSVNVSAAVGKALRVYAVALNDVGQSPRSNIIELVGPLPGAPVLTSIDGSPSAAGTPVKYTWGAIPGAAGYRVYINGSLVQEGSSRQFNKTYAWNTGTFTVHVIPYTDRGTAGDTRSNTVSFNSALSVPGVPVLSLKINNSTGMATASWYTGTSATKEVHSEHYFSSNSTRVPGKHTVSQKDYTVNYGDTIHYRINAWGWAGRSAWTPVQSVTREVPAPTLSSPVSTASSSGITGTCTAGTLEMRWRSDAGSNAYGGYSSWATYTSNKGTANHTQSFGQTGKTEWDARCRVAVNGTNVYSSTKSQVVNLPTRALPAPSGGTWGSVPDVAWNSSRGYTMGTTVKFAEQCPAGSNMETSARWRDNKGGWGAWSNYSGWAQSPSVAETQQFTRSVNYGDGWELQVRARCVSGTATSPIYTSSVLRKSKSLLAPKGSSWDIVSEGYNASEGKVEWSTRIRYDGDNGRQCEPGSTLQSRSRAQWSTDPAWRSWSPWRNNAYTTSSNFLRYGTWYGLSHNIQYESRCAAQVGSHVSGTSLTGEKKLTATMPKPTSLTLHTDTFRTAKWSAKCYAGTTVEYKWEKNTGAFHASVGWGTTTQYFNNASWGNGTHTMSARCVSNKGGAQSPIATKTVGY